MRSLWRKSMQLSQPKTIYLKDYKPSDFFIESIHLTVDISEDHSIVTSEMKIKKREELRGQKVNLELNGEGMELLSLKLNGEIVSSDKFQVSSDKLVILNVHQDEFTLEVQNKIDPKNNSALEGFY